MFKRPNRRESIQQKRRRKGKTVQEPAQPVLKSEREIDLMRVAGHIVAKVHQDLREAIQPGVSTWDLEQVACGTIAGHDATSCFLGYSRLPGSNKNPFPGHVCISVNEELVHGIADKERILQSGDIVSIDVGVRYNGFIGDSAWSYAVGEISEPTAKLMQVTEESLQKGIEQAVAGNQVVEICRAIQRHVERNRLKVVRGYTGHGVGRELHEPPQVLNYVSKSNDEDNSHILCPGMVLAIEPMVQEGTWKTKTLKDKWTVVSADGSLAAHFEHTVAITENGTEILTIL